MSNRFLSCLCMLMCLCSAPTFAQTTLPLGQQLLSFDDQGIWNLMDDQGRTLFTGQTMFYAKGWRSAQQSKSDIKREGDTMTWVGQIIDKASGIACDFRQTVEAAADQITILITLTPKGEIAVEDTPFVDVVLPLSLHQDQSINIGKPYTLPTHNQWGWSHTIKLDLTGNKLIFSDPTSMSVWQAGKPTPTQCDIRTKMMGSKLGKNKTISQPYQATIRIPILDSKPQAANNNTNNKPVPFVGQVDVLASSKKKAQAPVRDPQTEYLTNYQRVLNEPAPSVFDHAVALEWIDQGLNQRKDNQSASVLVDKVQSYLQSLSIAYDLQSRSDHLQLFNELVSQLDTSTFDSALHDVLASLKQGQTDGLLDVAMQTLTLAESLEKQAIASYGVSYYPGQSPNVHSFVKALYLNGYKKHRDGLNSGEPYPWDITWDTGLSLILPGEKTDYTVDRTWTTNTWHNRKNGMAIFFSVLTPITLLEHVETLNLDELNSPVTHLVTPDRKVSIVAGKIDSITLPKLSDNWFALRTGKGVLLLFTGQQPQTLTLGNNTVQIKWDEQTFAAILALPNTVSTDDIVKQAGFWGNVVIAQPMQAVELSTNQQVEYRYAYRTQQDSWNRTPLHISPIPYLAAMSDDTDFKSLALANNNSFNYRIGQRATWSTQNIAHQPMYRGLNDDAKYLANPGRAQQWVDMGATCVRVCIYAQQDDQVGYKLIHDALEQCSKVGLKVLIDPHDFIYKTTSKGLPTQANAPEKFAAMWEKLATISQSYKDTVIGYDLYNELRLRTEQWDEWQPIANQTIRRIRAIDNTTPIYSGCTDMSNATGYHATKKFEDANVIYSFHHYAMHSFTHQNVFRHNPREAYVYYPGWTPLIDWSAKQTYGDADLLWWDRWSMPASIWPALKFAAKNKVFLHCGEFAPIGWSRPYAAQASMLWTMDAMAMLEQRNIVWHLWNKGFGLTIDQVKEKVTKVWQEHNTPYQYLKQ